MSPWWTEAEVQIVIDTYSTHSVRQQLALLPGRTVKALTTKRRDLVRAGRLNTAVRHGHLQTRYSMEEAIAWVQNGVPIITAGRRVKRSASALYQHARSRYGSITELRRGFVYSLSEVARLFGSTFYKADRWRRNGWLRVQRQRKGTNYYVTSEAIQTFIEDRAHWMQWEAEAITDPDWREYALELRKAAGGCWLSRADIGALRHYSANAVLHWIKRGWLPAVFDGMAWWVWSADLDGFVVPGKGPKRKAA